MRARATRTVCVAPNFNSVAATFSGRQSQVEEPFFTKTFDLDQRAENERESQTVGQADVRKVQDHPPQWPGARDLLESTA
jgi:hypothetical protein